jgi:hypothetical protein
MEPYKEAVFKAIMWSQGVENLVRDCILKCVANGRLKPTDNQLEKIKNTFGLGGLAYEFKPCIPEDLFSRLVGFSKDRNELAHRAADNYLTNALVGVSDEELERELWKLQENTKVAGDLYGELLDLHSKLSA